MKKKISKLQINKMSIANFNQKSIKGGRGSILCAFTEGASCQDACNPTINLACTFGCHTNWC